MSVRYACQSRDMDEVSLDFRPHLGPKRVGSAEIDRTVEHVLQVEFQTHEAVRTLPHEPILLSQMAIQDFAQVIERPATVAGLELEAGLELILAGLRAIPNVHDVQSTPPFSKVYGKRIIIIGGGAQVGQVAMGAITEADRHNIRGEHISVDTIPLVGEKELAAAVRAVVRLPRVRLLVLAGALMGGEITKAVEEVRRQGLAVISLNMAGSVPDAVDLVVTDPVQAGVMAVMAVAETAKFDILRQQKRRY